VRGRGREIFPRCTSENIEKALLILSENNERPLRVEELSSRMSLKRSAVNQVLSVLLKLGLISDNLLGNKYTLTPLGQAVVEAIKNEDKEKLARLGEKAIERSKVLSEAYRIIKENKELSYNEIGLEVAKKFNKTWKTKTSYEAIGRACVQILNFFNLVEKKEVRGTSRKYFGKRKHENVLFPTAEADFIISTLRQLRDGPNNVSQLVDTQKKQEKFRSLIDLELVRWVGEYTFELTDKGRKLRDSIGTEKENEVFRHILLQHPHVLGVLNILREGERKNLSTWDIADAINRYNGGNWSSETSKHYAYKFLSWLKKAGIVEEGNHGYNLKEEVIWELRDEGREDMEEKLKEELMKNDVDGIFPLESFLVKVEKKLGDITISRMILRAADEPGLKGKKFKAEIETKGNIALVRLITETGA